MDIDTNVAPNQTPTPPPSNSDSNNTVMAILAYLGILVVIPLIAAKDNQFAKFHAKQGLVLLICEVIGWFILVVPFFGWIVGPILELAFLVMIILGIVNVVNHQMKELPIIGHFATSFKF
jgi:uncharacterized membrane protein